MHARINYVDIKPDNFAEVDPFWRNTVKTYDGLVKGYFLRDGDTAHTLSVVLFEDEEKMTANTKHSLSETVKKAADHRLSEPVLHHLEVCAHLAQRPGELGCARVVDVTLKVDRMAEVIADWAEGVGGYGDEFKGGYMCGDRASGKVKSVTLWTSREAIEANEQGGAFQSAVAPYEDLMAVPPVRSYWGVRVIVG